MCPPFLTPSPCRMAFSVLLAPLLLWLALLLPALHGHRTRVRSVPQQSVALQLAIFDNSSSRHSRRKTVGSRLLELAEAIAGQEAEKAGERAGSSPTAGDLLSSISDMGLIAADGGCFESPVDSRLGCSMNCICMQWEQCYPRYLHWDLDEASHHRAFDLGACQLTLGACAGISAILFVVCALGVAIARAALLAIIADREGEPVLMVKGALQLEKGMQKQLLEKEAAEPRRRSDAVTLLRASTSTFARLPPSNRQEVLP